MLNRSRGLRIGLAIGLTAIWLVTGALALGASSLPPEPAGPDQAEAAPVAPGRLALAVAPGFDEAALRALVARSGARLERWLPRLGLAALAVPPGREAHVAAALRAVDAVDFVTEVRLLAQVAETPSDPYWENQWGMARVGAPAAWDLAWADPATAIAVIDTGVQLWHWDLQGRLWRNPGESAVDPITGQRTCDTALAVNGVDDDENGYVDDCVGYDFVEGDPEPMDKFGHGTAVAGIAAAATNNISPAAPALYEGVAGMGRQATLMILRSLNERGRGSALDIAAAIDYAAAQGAQVINLSLTFSPATDGSSNDIQMLQRAVVRAQEAGVLVVAASGNENYNGVDYPARFPGVLAVGASTRADERAWFSNYGSRLDLVAPGEGIFTPLLNPGTHSYGYYVSTGSGTSFAAPHVAGAAALVRALRPDLGQAAVRELICHTADDVGESGWDTKTGWGRLNVARAVSEAAIGLNLALAAEPPAVAAADRTAVKLRITAPTGEPAGLGARVALMTSLGAITPTLVTADSLGQADVLFAAGPITGTAHITATLGGLTVTLPITVTAPLTPCYVPLVLR